MAAPAISNPIARAGQKLLGTMLVDAGKITAAELERALELQQQQTADRLGKLLVDLGALAERDLLAVLSEQLGVPVVEASQFPPVAPEIKNLSPRFMRTAKFFPFDLVDGQVKVAIADPLDYETLDSIRLATNLEPQPHLALETEITDAIEKLYGNGNSGAAVVDADGEEISEDVEHLRDLALEAPVIRLVNALIARAVESRASDIHIEPMEDELRIRYRIDGVLYPIDAPPRQMGPAIIS